MKESIFNIKVNVDDNEYIYNSRNNGIIQIFDEELNKDENIRYLLSEGYYVEDDFDEIESLVKEVNANINSNNDELLITVALTERCNFECVYCYQDHKPKTLSMEDGKELVKVVREILAENKFKFLKIHYFGGEPLLNLEMIYFLDDEFKKVSMLYDIQYQAYITTNGSLLNKDILSKVKFKNVQLTFDGLENTHNNLRKSSFFKFQNTIDLIEDIIDHCERVTIRFNICEENKNDLVPFIDFIMNKFNPEKINFITARTIKFNEADKVNMVSFDEYTKLSLITRMKLKEYGMSLSLPQSEKYPCPFTNRNAFSITPNLIIKKCDESSILLDEVFSKNSIKEKNEYKILHECTKCKVLPLCLGGCSKTRETGYKSCVPEKNNIYDIVENYIRLEC